MIARGTRVSFELDSARVVAAPSGAEILHDPTGRLWPSDEVLVVRFAHTGELLSKPSKDAVRHLGPEPLRGRFEIPSRRGWTEVGDVRVVRYHFRGRHFEPEGHEHTFGEPTGIFARRRVLPVLMRRGEMLRLGPVVIDENGFRG